ncbi:hypothetical protein PIROE2DRAFT_68491 [Piromyces sp. E2]|nr:hypothetical protein PIROE2DRAFT_68491 [Piromyces sp. E2]|eukprot:OUM69767.1 hypothetical protein PIROE2DRAFT_68491 [Piromyces sp. E2]
MVAGYYITTHDSSLVQNDTTGDLYLCADEDGTIKCEQVTNAKPIGYLINAGVGDSDKRYIKCQANGDCGAYAPGDQNSCGNNHGDLYVVGEDTKVCGVENDDDELVLAGTNAITGQYFASVDTANDQLFGIANKAGYHIVLDFSGGAVTVDNTATRYRYTLKGKTAITARTDAHSLSADGQICKASNGSRPNAYEYVLANWVDATKDLTANIAYYVTEEYGKAA